MQTFGGTVPPISAVFLHFHPLTSVSRGGCTVPLPGIAALQRDVFWGERGANTQTLPGIMKPFHRPRKKVSILKKPLEAPNQPFILPSPESKPHKKRNCTYLQNKKMPPAKISRMQESSRNRVLCEEEEWADGCFSTRCGPPLLLLSLLLFSSSVLHRTNCTWKSSGPQQRLQWLFQKLTPLTGSDLTCPADPVCAYL